MTEESRKEKLDGWKAIADHLGKSVRTAQRWEAEHDVPIHRFVDVEDPRNASVYAYPDEIDAWWHSHVASGALESPRPQPDTAARRFSPGASASTSTHGEVRPFFLASYKWTVTAVLLALLPAAALLQARAGDPFYLHQLKENEFAVYDADGRELWRQAFGSGFHASEAEGRPWRIDDLDGDGSLEVIFAFQDLTDHPGPDAGLYCYSATGELLWHRLPGRRIIIDEIEYDNAYAVRTFETGAGPGGQRFVAVAATHRPHAPTEVSILNAAGEEVGEYWHFGYVLDIHTGDFDDDGIDEILLVGMNNATAGPSAAASGQAMHQAFLALIEHDIESAISPGPIDVPKELQRGKESAYITFPFPSASEVLGVGTTARQIRPAADGFLVDVDFSDASDRKVGLYRFDRGLEVTHLDVRPSLVILHTALYTEGRVALEPAQEWDYLRRIEPRVRDPAQ